MHTRGGKELTTRTLPDTRIAHYGREYDLYKISRRDENAAVRAGYRVQRRGTSYAYLYPLGLPGGLSAAIDTLGGRGVKN